MYLVSTAQWIGKRQEQQDALGTLAGPDDSHVLVLADGMGGAAGGAIASRICVESALVSLARKDPPLEQVLRDSLSEAVRKIDQHSRAHPETEGMGATLVAALIERQRLSWVSVGDSHLYLWRGQTLEKLNADHSMKPQLARLVAEGELSPEAAARDPKRHMLLSALTATPPPQVDLQLEARVLEPGDLVLLASDGLDSLSEDDVIRLLAAHPKSAPPAQLTAALLAAVRDKARPRQDNLSLVVLQWPEDAAGPTPAPPAATPTAHGWRRAALILALAALVGPGLTALALWPPFGPRDIRAERADHLVQALRAGAQAQVAAERESPDLGPLARAILAAPLWQAPPTDAMPEGEATPLPIPMAPAPGPAPADAPAATPAEPIAPDGPANADRPENRP